MMNHKRVILWISVKRRERNCLSTYYAHSTSRAGSSDNSINNSKANGSGSGTGAMVLVQTAHHLGLAVCGEVCGMALDRWALVSAVTTHITRQVNCLLW
jgi:hypothetical protein